MPAPSARPAHAEMHAAFDDTGRDGDTHIYFDAQDTFGEDPLSAATRSAGASEPRVSMSSTVPASADPLLRPGSQGGAGGAARASDRHRRQSYDFEQPSYFPASPGAGPTPSASRRSPGVSRSGSMSASYTADGAGSPGGHLALPLHHSRAGGRAPTPLAQVRAALGRFGRMVGMRVPGATYESLQANDDDDHQHSALAGPSTQSASRRAGVYGGGTNQDGVFANLSAKPERRRRRARDGRGAGTNGDNGNDNTDDRGSDDDLEDETLPPTYQAAAADAAPPYWETTILGPSGVGGVLYPMAPGGVGWTPGGAQVGEVEDLILEGLPVGNFFGFAWNLAVSMCFQFVGFLLTYLLHTTHAAKCGSRAGLGVTLIQYGFYLHSRAAEGLGNVQNQAATVDFSGNPNTIGNGPLDASALFFGDSNHDRNPGDGNASPGPVGTGWWGTHAGRRSLFGARDWSPEAFAAQGNADNFGSAPAFFGVDDANSASLASAALSSTEWFAYFLIMLGSFLLFTSVFQYWRVVRWGRGLVESARRREREERVANEAATGAASTDGQADNTAANATESAAPTGFLERMRAAWATRGRRSGSASQRSGEDWVVFPGMSAASRRARREAAGQDPNAPAENVGDGVWWASIGPGRRLGGDQAPGIGSHADGEDSEDESFGILGSQSESAHYSPEEQRLIRSLREAGMLD